MKTISQKYLPEFVYWGIDGSITTFAIVAWSVGANLDASVILILWFANVLADGFSMSVGAYLSADASEEAVEKKERFYKACATFVSFIVLGLIPLSIYVLEYFWAIFSNTFLITSVLTVLSFAFIGYMKSFVARSSLFKNMFETILLWIAAAGLAYYVWYALEKII